MWKMNKGATAILLCATGARSQRQAKGAEQGASGNNGRFQPVIPDPGLDK
jgi:rhodanese-related sulfurtransferase